MNDYNVSVLNGIIDDNHMNEIFIAFLLVFK